MCILLLKAVAYTFNIQRDKVLSVRFSKRQTSTTFSLWHTGRTRSAQKQTMQNKIQEVNVADKSCSAHNSCLELKHKEAEENTACVRVCVKNRG